MKSEGSANKGARSGSNFYNVGSVGRYWSSSLYTSVPYFGCYLYFISGYFIVYGSNRFYGFTVRPVR